MCARKFQFLTNIVLSRATRIARGNSLCGVQIVVVVNFDVITDTVLFRATRIARGNSLCGVQTVVVVNFNVLY